MSPVEKELIDKNPHIKEKPDTQDLDNSEKSSNARSVVIIGGGNISFVADLIRRGCEVRVIGGDSGRMAIAGDNEWDYRYPAVYGEPIQNERPWVTSGKVGLATSWQSKMAGNTSNCSVAKANTRLGTHSTNKRNRND